MFCLCCVFIIINLSVFVDALCYDCIVFFVNRDCVLFISFLCVLLRVVFHHAWLCLWCSLSCLFLLGACWFTVMCCLLCVVCCVSVFVQCVFWLFAFVVVSVFHVVLIMSGLMCVFLVLVCLLYVGCYMCVFLALMCCCRVVNVLF